MPTCRNCGSHVTEQFVRVAFPSSVTDPPGCPRCDDMTSKTGEPGYRKKRNQ